MRKANEPAFPHDSPDYVNNGLTKREYIAAMAMQGELAGQFYEKPGISVAGRSNCWTIDSAARLARNSVAFADALIAELEKTEKE